MQMHMPTSKRAHTVEKERKNEEEEEEKKPTDKTTLRWSGYVPNDSVSKANQSYY